MQKGMRKGPGITRTLAQMDFCRSELFHNDFGALASTAFG